jgi:hypothetical protein
MACCRPRLAPAPFASAAPPQPPLADGAASLALSFQSSEDKRKRWAREEYGTNDPLPTFFASYIRPDCG